MLWRSDKRKNSTDNGKPIEQEAARTETPAAEAAEASVAEAPVAETAEAPVAEAPAAEPAEAPVSEAPAAEPVAEVAKTAHEGLDLDVPAKQPVSDEAVARAEEAILAKARQDELEARKEELKAQQLEEEFRKHQVKIQEGRRRLAQLEEEARVKRMEAEAAAERAREAERVKMRENFLAARREEEAAKAKNQAAIEQEIREREKESIEEKSRLAMAKKQAQLEKKQAKALDQARRKDQIEAVNRRRAQEAEEARLRKIREAEEARARRIQAEREAEEARLRKIKEEAEERARQAQLKEEARIRRIREAEEARARKAEEIAQARARKAEAAAQARAKRAAEIAAAKAKRDAAAAAAQAKKEAAAAAAQARKEAAAEAARKAKLERQERQRLLAEEKQKAKLYKEQRRAEEKKKRHDAEMARREERHQRAVALKKERDEKAELRRKERIARKSAELGGGVVNIHGTQVSTEIQPVARFSLRTLLGLKSKEEKMATSEEELRALQEEREQQTAEAREAANTLRQVRLSRLANSRLGRLQLKINAFAERRKKELLVSLGAVLIAVVCTAGVFNHYTAYEYSYNGRNLGYVKNKEDVLQITDMVQKALTQDKDMTVVISARDDIDFKRVMTFNKDITLDDTDAVLKRLTYMGEINVKAYGIYINGEKVGAVESKQVAADALQDIKDKYKSKKKGTEIVEAIIVENVEVKKSNTPLRELQSERQLVNTLCTSGHKETLHTVVPGDTLADLAKSYNTTEDKLLEDNPSASPERLVVGSTIVVKQNAPVMTVKITEVRTYDKVVPFKTKKKKSDELYEDDEQVEQEGENGLTELTDRTVSVNGELVETKNLKSEIKKKPVKKIVVIGTKERPPTVGDGHYQWPVNGTVTSGFGGRWGRMHEGIDIGVPTGTPVYAADGGTVTTAGYTGAYGNLVCIDHQNGMETRYGHNSSLVVHVGDKVYKGQLIAYAGSTGRSTGPHCHFEIRVNGTAVNPLPYLP